jgi:hypothetical protein
MLFSGIKSTGRIDQQTWHYIATIGQPKFLDEASLLFHAGSQVYCG